LFDVLRQRGNNYVEYNAREVPHVLIFEAELVLDGRSLPRPVNYALARIVPPEDLRSIVANGPLSYSIRGLATAPGSAA
jgi:hypothetical protein